MNMNNQRPDVNDEEIGMRTFQLRKARAVERAMERLRGGMKADWALLSHARDRGARRGSSASCGRTSRAPSGTTCTSASCSYADVRADPRLRAEIANHTRNSVDVLNDVDKVVVAKG